MNRKILFFLSLFALTIFLVNPPVEVRADLPGAWQIYTSGMNVNDISESEYVMWVATGGGFGKVDKSTHSTAFLNTGNSQLPSNDVRSIADGGNYTVWAGTYSEGLVWFDDITASMTIYNTGNSGLPSDHVRSLLVDDAGTLWAGTTGGLASYDGEDWSVYTTSNSDLPHNWVNTLVADDNGTIWAGTDGGVAGFDGASWTVYTSANSDLPENRVHALAFDSEGIIWIATHGGGLAQYDGDDWTVYTTANTNILSNYIYSVAVDGDGTVWLGSHPATNNTRLTMYDGAEWTHYTVTNSNMYSGTISVIRIDETGEVWIGSNGGGLAVYDGSIWRRHPTSGSTMPSNSVRECAVGNDGIVWIGTSGGLATYDPGIMLWDYFNQWNSDLTDNRINTVAVDHQGTAWIGTQLGMTVVDGDSVKQYYIYNSPLPHNIVNSISVDDNNIKWIGTYNGLLAFDGTEGVVYTSGNSPLPSSQIWSIDVDASGTVWVGTSEGLASYDGSDWTVYTSSMGIPSGTVWAVAFGENGALWVATGTGLASFDGMGWVTYTAENSGLAGNQVTATMVDLQGRIWAGTNGNGIAMIDDGEWKVIDKSNSILESDFISSLNMDAGGNVWISTGAGLVLYYENSFVSKTLDLILPAGGDTWEPGSEQQIVWTSSNLDAVRIEYSIDGGASWIMIVDSVSADAGSYTWIVPESPSDESFVRIRSVSGSITSMGRHSFTIMEPPDPSITLIAPAGGEEWLAGREHAIVWTSEDIDSVLIEITIDDGNEWIALETVPADQDTFRLWIPYNVMSDAARVRVSDASDPDVSDITDGVFSIVRVQAATITAWGLEAGATGGWTLDVDTDGAVTASGDAVPAEWMLLRGVFPPLNIEMDGSEAIVATGTMELTGGNAGDGFRMGIFTIPPGHEGTVEDGVWMDVTGEFTGYLAAPVSGSTVPPTWGADGARGTFGAISDMPWVIIDGARAFVLCDTLPLPPNAVVSEGVYEFAFSVSVPETDAIDIRYYLLRSDSTYFIGSAAVDTAAAMLSIHPPVAVGFSLNQSAEAVALTLRDVAVGIGEPLALPELGVTDDPITFVGDEGLPTEYSLLQNYPNPFNPSTHIEFTLKEQTHVLLEVYDILGRRVATLVNEMRPRGAYTVAWNGANQTGQTVSGGIYIYRMQAGDFVETRRMVFLK
jgi:ligand-binding sensor domain-containing protein